MNESTKPQSTPKGYIQTFIIIHLALVAGPILAFLFTVDVPESWELSLPKGNNFADYLPLIIGLGSVVISELLYRQLTAKFNSEDGVKEKMSQLLTASLVRFAVLEAAAFFCFFNYKGSNEQLTLICGLIPVAIMFFIFPTKEKIISALKLNREQKTQFMKMDEIIN